MSEVPPARATLALAPLAALLALSACGEAPRRDRVTQEKLLEIATVETALPAVEADRDLALRIVHPTARGRYPLIVLSHAEDSSPETYTRLADHWASRGYVVILPAHRDARAAGQPPRPRSFEQLPGAVRSRVLDMKTIADSLDAIEKRVRKLAGRIDRERIVAAGHSLGGYTAMLVTGLRLRDPRDGSVVGFEETRFDALVLIGDPGSLAMLPAEPWRTIRKPTFVATGTTDFGELGDGRTQAPFEYALAESAAPSSHHVLFIRGMDHYLGGVIARRDVPGPPDLAALAAIQEVSTAFLDAYLKGRSESTAYLARRSNPNLANGRGSLSAR
jgi:dienelactone hydrolase